MKKTYLFVVIFISTLILAVSFFPVRYAVATGDNITIKTVGDLLSRLRDILDTVVPFIVGLAVFVIIWGIFTYLTHAGEEEKRAEAKKYIIWGIIGVFFMVSIWGFVNILLNTFNLDRQIGADKIPKVPQISDGGTGGPCTNRKRPDGTAC